MKNNTIFEYVDNGIIIRYEASSNFTEVKEVHNDEDCGYHLTPNIFLNAVARSYGSIVANTIDCFDDDIKQEALGYKVLLEVVPVFEEKHLFPKRKKQ